MERQIRKGRGRRTCYLHITESAGTIEWISIRYWFTHLDAKSARRPPSNTAYTRNVNKRRRAPCLHVWSLFYGIAYYLRISMQVVKMKSRKYFPHPFLGFSSPPRPACVNSDISCSSSVNNNILRRRRRRVRETPPTYDRRMPGYHTSFSSSSSSSRFVHSIPFSQKKELFRKIVTFLIEFNITVRFAWQQHTKKGKERESVYSLDMI